MIHKILELGALVAFGAAVLGDTLFGHAGLELVAAGLLLHAGADLISDVVEG